VSEPSGQESPQLVNKRGEKKKKETSWTSAKKRTVKRDKENVGIKENVHVPSLTSAKTTPHGTSISDGIRKQITV